MSKIYVFTLPTCVPCNALKKTLEENSVEYTLCDMSSDSDYVCDLATKFGIRSAPTIIIEKDNVVHKLKTYDELKNLLQ